MDLNEAYIYVGTPRDCHDKHECTADKYKLYLALLVAINPVFVEELTQQNTNTLAVD